MKNNRLVKFMVMVFMLVMLAGCTQADKVSENISLEADNFNVVRRVAVINMRTDKVVFEVIGNISIESSSGRLDVVAETSDGVYKKHMINMTEWNMYVVEDLYGAEVNKYKYSVNYMPESIIPVEVISSD